jgi:hypothetical protein
LAAYGKQRVSRARSRRCAAPLGGRFSLLPPSGATVATNTAVLSSSSSGYGGSNRQYGYSSTTTNNNANSLSNNKNSINNNKNSINNNQYGYKSSNNSSLTAGSWTLLQSGEGVEGSSLVSGPGPPLAGIRPRSKSRSRLTNTNSGLATIWPDRKGIWLPP